MRSDFSLKEGENLNSSGETLRYCSAWRREVPEITVAIGKEAREPKTHILLVIGQAIGLLRHATE